MCFSQMEIGRLRRCPHTIYPCRLDNLERQSIEAAEGMEPTTVANGPTPQGNWILRDADALCQTMSGKREWMGFRNHDALMYRTSNHCSEGNKTPKCYASLKVWERCSLTPEPKSRNLLLYTDAFRQRCV